MKSFAEKKIFGKYFTSTDPRINYLIKNSSIKSKLKMIWRICPDHIVFLGKEPIIINDLSALKNIKSEFPFIFYNDMILQNKNINRNQLDQLICFFDILVRQENLENIDQLSDKESNVLLDWDEEKYRQKISNDNP